MFSVLLSYRMEYASASGPWGIHSWNFKNVIRFTLTFFDPHPQTLPWKLAHHDGRGECLLLIILFHCVKVNQPGLGNYQENLKSLKRVKISEVWCLNFKVDIITKVRHRYYKNMQGKTFKLFSIPQYNFSSLITWWISCHIFFYVI